MRMAKQDIVLAGPDFPQEILATLLDSVQDQKARAKGPSKEQQYRDAISAMLSHLGGLTVQDDSLLFEGEKFVLPAQYEGKVESAIDFLINYKKQQEQPHQHRRAMNYMPYDGAHAFMEVMKSITGTTGFGVTKYTFFGPVHPQFVTINTSYDTTTQVPWGDVSFPSYQAEFHVGYTHNEDHKVVFELSCLAPRKWRKHIEAIFGLVEKHLQDHSIYRGKAIDGQGPMNPNFLNLNTVDPEKVVYSKEVMEQLSANVWVPIEYTPMVRALGDPLKRAVLFAGPYGTGKSLGAMITGQKAVENGWTFIYCRTGKDDPAEVLKTAELYAPAAVVIEDVDIHADGGSAVDISRMLDMLDGITSKGVEIVALFTTNHLERIQKGALRPGRIDAVIEINDLDAPGFQKLVEITVGKDRLSDSIAWDEVAEAFRGFLPAFVVEAARRSQRYTMARNEGRPGIMTTKDLVAAAESLRPQLDLHEGAKEGANVPTVDAVLREITESVIKRTTNAEIGGFQVEEATILNGGVKR
jgi:transitional endoplasmic reticulum ATPase